MGKERAQLGWEWGSMQVYSSQGELSGCRLRPGCVRHSSQGSHRERRLAEWKRKGNMQQHQRNEVCQGSLVQDTE